MGKILVVHCSVGRSPEACIETIVENLKEHGNDVTIFTEFYDRNKHCPPVEYKNGIKIFRTYNWEREIFACLERIKNSRGNHNRFFLNFWLGCVWWMLKIVFAGTIRIFPFLKAELLAYKMEKKYEEEPFDLIFATTAPFFAVQAASIFCKAHPEVKMVVYMFDPYINNIMYANSSRAIKKRICAAECFFPAASAVIATPEVYKAEAASFKFPCPVEKIALPLLHEIKKVCTEAPLLANDTGRLKLFFCGALHSFRNPEFIFRLLLHEELQHIEVHIAGNGDLSSIEKYRAILGDRLIYHGLVEPEKCYEAMFDADILLHLGNKTNTQIPGKLFEYMATGKPIIHLYYIDDDGCLPYLKKYPLQLSIRENTSEDKCVSEWLAFWGRSEKRVLAFDEIETECSDFLAKNVLERVRQTVDRVLKQ